MEKSFKSKQAYILVNYLQSYFKEKLNNLSEKYGKAKKFKLKKWSRSVPKEGGGHRFESDDDSLFNRASINVSGVHYNQNDSKKILSADAISSIIHPLSPYAPSIHIHFSYTQNKDESGCFRLMADLNPSIYNEEFKKYFSETLIQTTGKYYSIGSKQGDKYFYIPALKRTRGVKHFYLENFHTDDFENDLKYVKKVALSVINTYIDIIDMVFKENKKWTKYEANQQLDYHSLYFLQVLTLDRGTSLGLLVQDKNDIGIMGSIPAYINKTLLQSWIAKVNHYHKELLKQLISCLKLSYGNKNISLIDDETKLKLANTLRQYYKKYPETLVMQASGDILPPTFDNHK